MGIPFVREETSLVRATYAFGKFLEEKENFLIGKISYLRTLIRMLALYPINFTVTNKFALACA